MADDGSRRPDICVRPCADPSCRGAFGLQSSFDILLSILIGSNVSRALTQGSPYFPTLAATAGIVILYWVAVQLAQRSDFVGLILTGRATVIARDGRADARVMRRGGVSHLELAEAIHRAHLLIFLTWTRLRWPRWSEVVRSLWCHLGNSRSGDGRGIEHPQHHHPGIARVQHLPVGGREFSVGGDRHMLHGDCVIDVAAHH